MHVWRLAWSGWRLRLAWGSQRVSGMDGVFGSGQHVLTIATVESIATFEYTGDRVARQPRRSVAGTGQHRTAGLM
jgi:hypothetical protein